MDLRKLLSPRWLEEIYFLEGWNLILEWNKRIYIEMGAVFHRFRLNLRVYDALISKLPQFISNWKQWLGR